tara:strand:- start:577 stop:822 length:246 start_codon:yes stop_codon:yes gene_type:complete
LASHPSPFGFSLIGIPRDILTISTSLDPQGTSSEIQLPLPSKTVSASALSYLFEDPMPEIPSGLLSDFLYFPEPLRGELHD